MLLGHAVVAVCGCCRAGNACQEREGDTPGLWRKRNLLISLLSCYASEGLLVGIPDPVTEPCLYPVKRIVELSDISDMEGPEFPWIPVRKRFLTHGIRDLKKRDFIFPSRPHPDDDDYQDQWKKDRI